MIKWLVTVLIALVVFSMLRPVMNRIGIGRLPGDFSVTVKGRRYDIPLASTVLLSLIAFLIGRFW